MLTADSWSSDSALSGLLVNSHFGWDTIITGKSLAAIGDTDDRKSSSSPSAGTEMPAFASTFSRKAMRLSLTASCSSASSSLSFISASERTLFTVGWFLTFFALAPKRSDESVSSSLSLLGEQVIISAVLELPPRLSCSTRVSFESL